MKYLICAVSLIAVGWGIWIFQADRGMANRNIHHEMCQRLYSADPTYSLHEPIDELVCEGQGWQEKERIERNATIAIIVGGITALVSGLLIAEDLAPAKQHKQKSHINRRQHAPYDSSDHLNPFK